MNKGNFAARQIPHQLAATLTPFYNGTERMEYVSGGLFPNGLRMQPISYMDNVYERGIYVGSNRTTIALFKKMEQSYATKDILYMFEVAGEHSDPAILRKFEDPSVGSDSTTLGLVAILNGMIELCLEQHPGKEVIELNEPKLFRKDLHTQAPTLASHGAWF